jgi:Flp pilus assembly protein TadD
MKNNILQQLSVRFLVLGTLAISLAGCADVLDQTNGDLNSKTGGMAYIADQMHAQGDDEGAMEFYARAIQRSPDDVSTRAKLTALFEAHGAYKDAAEQYRALVKLDPKNADYWRGYGRTLIRLDHPKDAKDKYETAVKLAPDDTRSLNGLGVTLDLLGDHAGAQEKYKAALDQKSDDVVTINNLSHSYIVGGNYDEAIKILQPQLDNSAAPPALRQNLAEAYAKNGNDKEAERLLSVDFPSDQVKKKIAHFHATRAKVAQQAKPPAVKAAREGAAEKTQDMPVRTVTNIAPKLQESAPPPEPVPASLPKAQAAANSGDVASPYAMLGSFTNSDYAQDRLDTIKKQFPGDTEQLMMEIVPGTDELEGTPIFNARAGGFKNPAAAKAFCDKLSKGGAFCKPHDI